MLPTRRCLIARTPSAAHRGFTLIEVMITVAIIGILSAVAYPSYRDYITRGRLTDATTGLSTFRAQMERHFQDNRSYATVGSFVTPCDTSTAVGPRTFGQFVVSCSGTPTATAFMLQAVGSGAVLNFTFTINQSDLRTTVAPTGWTSCTTGWMTRKGQTCS